MSSSGATTRPTCRSGSTRAFRANTSYSRTERWTRVMVMTGRPSYRQAPELEDVAALLGQPPAGPGRIPDDSDLDLLDLRLGEQPLPNVLQDEVVGRAAHRREGEVDADLRGL